MVKYFEKLFGEGLSLVVIIALAFANWLWPFPSILGDTPIFRFLWLGIFFLLADIFIEIIIGASKEVNLIADAIGFSRELKKLSDSFRFVSAVELSGGQKADHVIVGSSGVWLLMIQEGEGDVYFNGDDIVQNQIVLRGLISNTLEKSYSMAVHLKKNLNKDFRVTPVLVFSNSKVKLVQMPNVVRGVHVAVSQDVIALVENTDVQLVDKNTIDEIYNLLKNPLKDKISQK